MTRVTIAALALAAWVALCIVAIIEAHAVPCYTDTECEQRYGVEK